MDGSPIPEILVGMFDPVVLGAAAVAILALLTGGVARLAEMLERG